ncbi:PREDICTED: putative inorganic phosphate cotransporter [Eufriesea mexicana]|uniref:putative inorganic phosphate cotransporter n=1 Tax=Eufriesea mexicana TaxID=516756 RepID=UPI00083C7EB9|nr:PREDICTED: putative inorganic phosphate cotransporter [Eufriesea mexicana]
MKNEELAEEQNAGKGLTKSHGGLGIRHLQVFLLFLGMVIGYCLRVSISVAVVAMTNANSFEVFPWDSIQQSTIQSAFFWGYTIMQIPSGYIAAYWSGQKLLSVGLSLCGILQILTPIVAHYGGYISVCVCRAGIGLCQSCLLPCVHTLLSKWAPPTERARLATFAYAGAQFGTVICFPITAQLAVSSAGWPSIFYVFGALSILWGAAFFIFGADSPANFSRISEREKRYIENSFAAEEHEKSDTGKNLLKTLSTPWKAIFTSVPMWALIIVHCGQNWGYWTLVTELPTYMNDVLHFKLSDSGLLSGLPYLVMWLLSFPVCWLADYYLEKGVSKGLIRKSCNTMAHWGPAIALIIFASLSVDDPAIAVTFLVVAVALNAGSLCGFQINHIDLSPNFAGRMMSITNCIASVIAIIAPIICSVIVSQQGNPKQLWNIVFFLSAAIYILGNLVFIIFGSTDIQPWNNPKAQIEKENEKELTMA